MKAKIKYCVTLLLIIAGLITSIKAFTAQNNEQIASTLITATQKLPINQRIEQISFALLNKPYQIDPLGEGPGGQYDQQPLYRFDTFDCETYVNTVLALAQAKNLNEFHMDIRRIAYINGEVSFKNRCHFPDADWVPNNIKNNFVREITTEVAGAQNTKINTIFIDKKNWYKKMGSDRIKIPGLTSQQISKKLTQLHAESITAKNIQSSITYIPLNKLVDQNGIATEILQKIPTSSIVFFVSKNPSIAQQIGTEVNISHMGFIIWHDNKPYLRAASSLKGQTIDLPLIDYLKYYLSDPTMKGIALFRGQA